MKQHLFSKAMFVLMAMLMVNTKMLAQEPYAVLSEENGEVLLTFYYDNQKVERDGMSVGPFISLISSWDNTRNKITTVVFDASFANCTSITSTASWFSGCENLEKIIGIENLKTDNVTDMKWMFSDCRSLTSLDVSRFNTANVTNMKYMFNGCSSLTSLDLRSFNTANVTDMSFLFDGCSNLTSLNGSHFNTGNVKCLDGLFRGCSSLTTLDVSHFNTAKVGFMSNMFRGCIGLTSLDISSFNTANVYGMNHMFRDCSSLTTIYASDLWDARDVNDDSGSMFKNCTNLVGGQGTKYNSRKTDATYARIDGGEDAPGYFTDKTATGVKGVTSEADRLHAPVYNLSGQRLTAPRKGINIIGGKKVVVK